MTEFIGRDRPEQEVGGNYELYEKLFERSSVSQPHREGMSPEEFAAAVGNPDVASSVMEVNGEQFEVPQVCPIEQFEWLNGAFYHGKFTEEAEAGNIVHFAAFTDVEPSEAVNRRLYQIAEHRGVVAIDFPEGVDPDYPDRVIAHLNGLGVNVDSVEELGTQTYYAGQVTLKRPHDRLERPLGLFAALKKKIEDRTYDPRRIRNGASLVGTVSEDQAAYMNGFYEKAFKALNESSPVRQGLTPEEFHDMLVSDEEVAKIVASKDGDIAALCIMGEDVTKFSWLNPEYFEATMTERSKNKQIVYFPALAADPERLGDNTVKIVELIAQLVEAGDNEIVVAFDCCDFNKGFLDVFLQEMINATPEATIDFKTIAVQRFLALKTSVRE